MKGIGNVVLNKDIHEFDKKEKERGIEEMIQSIKEFLGIGKNYKQLWEEQNKMLDDEKLKSRRKDKEIMRLKVKLEKLEKQINGG